MIIQLVIDKRHKYKLFVFVNDNEIGKFLFDETPIYVIDVKPLPGEVSRTVNDTDTHRVITVTTTFSPSAYLVMDKSKVETLLKKLF